MPSYLTFNNLLAGLVLLVCLGLAVHMMLSRQRQQRVNQGLRRLAWRCQDLAQRLRQWRRSKAVEKSAAAQAAQVIARAKSKKLDGTWEGNVYRPKEFDRKKRD
nr:hypothetical protein [uncultured Roseateles sp.]